VTVGIGGNDAGLVGVAEKCAELGATDPMGTSCRDHWAPGGNDQVAARIEATKPKIAAVLQGIHQRAPQARVAIVGYPDVLPKNGESCWPMVPLSPDDIRYIDELIVRINAMIAGQAAANDADFVDTYRDSGGHDVCKLPPNRWFEGLVPTEPAYPLHPNGKGEASMARSAIALLSRPRRESSGGGGAGGTTRGAARCLARRSAIGSANIGRVRIGYTRAQLNRRVHVVPLRRTHNSVRYCTKGGPGRLTAVFSRRGRVELVLSTAAGHGNRRVGAGSRTRALARAYPNRTRLAPSLFRAASRSELLFGVSRGRVAFVAVTTERVAGNAPVLVRALRLALR
jgi:hypothetical protein